MIQNVLYIIQDLNEIKNRDVKGGNLIKIRIKNNQQNYEISCGNSTIRINKYKAE